MLSAGVIIFHDFPPAFGRVHSQGSGRPRGLAVYEPSLLLLVTTWVCVFSKGSLFICSSKIAKSSLEDKAGFPFGVICSLPQHRTPNCSLTFDPLENLL